MKETDTLNDIKGVDYVANLTMKLIDKESQSVGARIEL